MEVTVRQHAAETSARLSRRAPPQEQREPAQEKRGKPLLSGPDYGVEPKPEEQRPLRTQKRTPGEPGVEVEGRWDGGLKGGLRSRELTSAHFGMMSPEISPTQRDVRHGGFCGRRAAGPPTHRVGCAARRHSALLVKEEPYVRAALSRVHADPSCLSSPGENQPIVRCANWSPQLENGSCSKPRTLFVKRL